jgi:murein L,D-transpeptidase YafK
MKFILITLFLSSFNLFAYLPIDEVKVYKSLHRMDLLFQGKVIKSYKVMLGRGGPNPKRQQGDLLVPEGQYVLDEKNPNSKFHRAIHISYPNEADIKRAQEAGVDPGGEVFIHGLPNTKSNFVKWLREIAVKIKNKTHSQKIIKKLDWTQGCVALSDNEIEEIYDNMPTPTPITIYP